MNLQQLIELSILDAMGLLDEDEQFRFEAAFRAAPPAVQAQVRREQTRLSRIEGLLPDVPPPAGLRAAVIDAVRREITLAREADEAEVAGAIAPPILKSRGVSPLWRAAALGLAAAAVVFGITTLQIRNEVNDLEESIRNEGIMEALREQFGPSFVQQVLFNADTRRVVFRNAGGQSRGEASLFVNPEWKQARFFHNGLASSEGKTFKLAIVDEGDRVVQVLDTFTSDGRLDGRRIAIPPTAKGRLAILTTSAGQGEAVVGRGEFPGSL